jgi:aryl-alcohol dehydrogenase-like predicted oxidoreductase
MEYVLLGKSKLKVSRICFGTLTMGPLQKRLSIEKGVSLALKAIEMGINFFDTAEQYQTYSYLKEIIKKSPRPIVVASKSYAYTYEDMVKSIEKARKEMDRDYIDIFLMHEQESILTMKGHSKAWEAIQDYKAKGIIKASGISTHHISGVRDAKSLDGLEIIHPLINYKGIGIVDGNLEEMLIEIKKAKKQGIGIYSMKPLGGGNLIDNYDKALKYIFSIKEIDSVAIGMQNILELEANVVIASNNQVSEKTHRQLLLNKKEINVEPWCIGCGKCIEKCSQGAIQLNKTGKASIDRNKCILCGYCASVCTDFCIKVY